MYKTFAAAFAAILASLLLTCVPFGPPDDYEEYTYTDVEYSPDGSSLTIYLDGSAPVRHSRALTLSLAKAGHDFFEVAFHHPETNTVARAVWETGHAAGVSGVVRNIDYASAFSSGAALGSGQGAAILFVGKKSDRTLLAVGKLAQVNGEVGTFIGPDAKTVTFEVAALKAGVSSNSSSSSFKTDAISPAGQDVYTSISAANTDVFNVVIGVRPFPLFRLDKAGSQYVHGEYQFEVVSSTTGPFAGIEFETYYRRGIIQKAPVPPPAPPSADSIVKYPTATVVTTGGGGSVTYNRIPRYSVGDGQYQTVKFNIITDYEIDGVTTVAAANIAAANTPFSNPVQFRIGPTSSIMNSHVFAFSFQVPVYPLTNIDSRAGEFSWYLRPGYDSYRDDLDDGIGGSGGAILIGTGDFEQAASASIYVKTLPDKTKYNGVTSTAAAGPWIFDTEGIEIYRQLEGSTNLVNLTDVFFVIKNAKLTTGGAAGVDIALKTGGNIQTLLEANHVSGKVTITVEYYGSPVVTNGQLPFIEATPSNPSYLVRNPGYISGGGVATTYITEFYIYYVPLPAGINFDVPDNRRFTITDSEDFNRFQATLNGSTGGTYIVALFHDFNLGSLVCPAGANVTLVIVAGNPDIIIGKSGTNVFNNNNRNNTYYIGVWPFDEILSAGGYAFESQPFYINAGGSYVGCNITANPPTGPNNSSYFIYGTGTKNVINMGATIINSGYLWQP